MKFGGTVFAFAVATANCSPTNQYPKIFEIQIRGDVRHVVFDVANGSATSSQRNCVKRIFVYAVEDTPVAPSSGDDREAVRTGVRWEAEAENKADCLGSLPREYGDSGTARVRIRPKPLRLGPSYGVAIRLDEDVLGSARFQVLPNGSLRPISLEEFMGTRQPHPR